MNLSNNLHLHFNSYLSVAKTHSDNSRFTVVYSLIVWIKTDVVNKHVENE